MWVIWERRFLRMNMHPDVLVCTVAEEMAEAMKAMVEVTETEMAEEETEDGGIPVERAIVTAEVEKAEETTAVTAVVEKDAETIVVTAVAKKVEETVVATASVGRNVVTVESPSLVLSERISCLRGRK